METFMTEYAKQLEAAVRDCPREYGYGLDRVPSVVAAMTGAVRDERFNKDSRAFKATCKALGIKHTYTAIRHFIDNHV